MALRDDAKQVFSLVVNGFTGQVDILDEAIARPDDILFRDAEGKTVEPQ